MKYKLGEKVKEIYYNNEVLIIAIDLYNEYRYLCLLDEGMVFWVLEEELWR